MKSTYGKTSDLPASLFLLTQTDGKAAAQQGMMRRTAVRAGLIPDGAAGQARLSFVTEGEASLHFCIQNGLNNEAIKVRNISAHFLVSQTSCSY